LRKSTVCMLGMALNLMLFTAMALHARWARARSDAPLNTCIAQVETFRLTDLCLFTEARYTRHPAMADRHAAFQDHPMAQEHFPSGSLVTPPFPRPHDRRP
jgi:hypothetical protein